MSVFSMFTEFIQGRGRKTGDTLKSSNMLRIDLFRLVQAEQVCGQGRQKGLVTVLASLGLKRKGEYIHSFCYYNKIPLIGYSLRTRGTFWLKVLEIQGLGILSGCNIPVERVLRWCSIQHGKRQEP